MQTTTTPAATNIFAASVKVKEAAPKKAEKKIFKAAIGNKVERWAKLKATIESDTAELKMLEGDIKTTGRVMFMDQYKAQRSTPDNFMIQDETLATCMFILMDKYTIVDENKAGILQQFEGLLNERVEYKFNPELVDKYGGILSELIMGSEDIEEADKVNLISGEKTFSVAKGSIDRLMLYENPDQVFELINPIVALKK